MTDRLSHIAARVTDDRNRAIDVARAAAVLIVCVGHWLMQVIHVTPDGDLRRAGLLNHVEWAHPLTWVLQVMPIFFLAGGYSNALSWRRARAESVTYGAWLHTRTRRLTMPLLPLLLFWTLVAPAAGLLGLGEDWLRIASRASLVPLWFLAVYLVVVAVAPLSLAAWERWGFATIAAGIALAALTDLISISTDNFAVGTLNLAFVWVTVHQLGYAWLDGRLDGTARRLALMLGSFVALVVLVVWGPYATSMVGVSGFGVDNALPPRVTLLFLGLWQTGMILLFEARLQRFARRPRVWLATVAIEARLMTIYLWHMVALGLTVAVAWWIGWGLAAQPQTAAWWWGRAAWIPILAVVTVLVCGVVGRFENPLSTRPQISTSYAVTDVVIVTVGVALMAWFGLVHDGRVLWGLPLVTLVALLATVRHARRADEPALLPTQPRRPR